VKVGSSGGDSEKGQLVVGTGEGQVPHTISRQRIIRDSRASVSKKEDEGRDFAARIIQGKSLEKGRDSGKFSGGTTRSGSTLRLLGSTTKQMKTKNHPRTEIAAGGGVGGRIKVEERIDRTTAKVICKKTKK